MNVPGPGTEHTVTSGGEDGGGDAAAAGGEREAAWRSSREVSVIFICDDR